MKLQFQILLVLISLIHLHAAPNIVYMILDDVGFADFSYQNPTKAIPTPQIDRISEQGIRLSRHYAQSTCSPSRAALMTGRYAINTGLTFPLPPFSTAGLPDDAPTLPQLLRKQGYEAHMVGKWHLGFAKWKDSPVGRGFQSFTGVYRWDVDSWTKMIWREPNVSLGVDWGRSWEDRTYMNYVEPRHATVALADEAEQVIRRHVKNSKKPLFLYLAFTAAHSPLQPMHEHMEKCQHLPHLWRREYCGMMVGLDEAIGNVTRTARELLGDNTILVVTSDNGGSTWFGGLNYPYRSGKTTPFEGGVRVPAFLADFSQDKRYFGQGGRTYSGIIHISDWLPTLYTIAGGNVKAIAKLDGKDVGSALRADQPSPRHEVLLEMYIKGEFTLNETCSALIREPWKLIQCDIRDPHWYYESSEDKMNSTDVSGVTQHFEKIIRAGEEKHGAGPYDMVRLMYTHRHAHGAFVKNNTNITLLFNLAMDPEEQHDVSTHNPLIVMELEDIILRIRNNRPKAPRWWENYNVSKTQFQTGDCSNVGVAPEHCWFVLPFLTDDGELLPPQPAKQRTDTNIGTSTDTKTVTSTDPTVTATEPNSMMLLISVVGVMVFVILYVQCCRRRPEMKKQE